MLTRRFLLRQLLAAALVVMLPFAALAQSARITFLHTNDVYEITPARGWGGFAPLMTMLREQRAAAPNTITTFGGDLISPSIMSGLLRGSQMVDMLNAVGTDIAVLGNHEFDFGPDLLRTRLGESHFPWLATNVRNAAGAQLPGTVDYVIREVAGFKIGFFGILTPETIGLSSPGADVRFLPFVDTAREAVRVLRERGADIVVGLTHLNIAEDREIVRTVPGIALLLGGHDHDPITFLEGNTLIFKAGHDAFYLGVVELTLTRQPPAAGSSGPATVDVTHAWRTIPVRGVAADAQVGELVQRYTQRLDTELNVEIGTVARPLDSRRVQVREAEAAIGNLIADAIRASTGADVGLMNGGGIRGDRTYDPGYHFTRRDVMTELPFGNVTVVLELKGSDLLEALENGVSRVEERQGRFPQVSGVRFTYDPSRPAMHRITEVTVNGQPLDPNRMYKVATLDFMQEGGDGFTSLARGRVLIDKMAGSVTASQVIAYIAERHTLDAAVEGRIVRR
jgi:2',3'-cyclic-nucleotide 2'-phosphodiesterase (5'-nucleotidase family)